MATAKCSALLCMVLVLTLAMQDLAECSTGSASLELQHRKFLMEMKAEMAVKSNGVPAFVSNGKNGLTEEELRRVPGGPDPMHHHGQDPKPRTP